MNKILAIIAAVLMAPAVCQAQLMPETYPMEYANGNVWWVLSGFMRNYFMYTFSELLLSAKPYGMDQDQG